MVTTVDEHVYNLSYHTTHDKYALVFYTVSNKIEINTEMIGFHLRSDGSNSKEIIAFIANEEHVRSIFV